MSVTYRFHHIGVNAENREEAEAVVKLLSAIFGIEPRIPAKGNPYLGPCIEVVAGGGRGTHGHIAIYTESLSEAVEDLASKGIECDPDSVKRNPDGTPYLIYLKQEFLGYAIHLMGDKKQ